VEFLEEYLFGWLTGSWSDSVFFNSKKVSPSGPLYRVPNLDSLILIRSHFSFFICWRVFFYSLLF
jgi:hypothetical protein